ncbi:Cyclin-dependent kinase-like 2 [Manis javanica]|nr:Cyclin-dependent kinase-like 2 [Manis javanica]
MSHIKTVPSTSLRDCSNGSMDHTKNPGMAIPPLMHSVARGAPSVNSGMSTLSGVQSNRVDEKTKKYCIPFVKPNKHSPSGIYNINVTTSVTSEKNLLQAHKKRREYSKTDSLGRCRYQALPCQMIWRVICLKWNTSTESHFGSELDAALTLEMTSSCEKSANILGEICGFDHILLSCLHFLRKALQKKERQTFKCFKGRCNKCPSDAISRYSQ